MQPIQTPRIEAPSNPSETPEINGRVSWLRERATAPNLAAYKSQLLSCADEIEALERRLREAEARVEQAEKDRAGYCLLWKKERERAEAAEREQERKT